VRAILRTRRGPLDPGALASVTGIVESVRLEGEPALRRHARRLGDLDADDPLWIDRRAMRRALEKISTGARALLERTAERICAFAHAQRDTLTALEVPIPGGTAGHRIAPVERAGCYAPGGRYPLPSSVLMTAVTARAAGVRDVCVASPRPPAIVLAAAALADVDLFLAAGGAHAIAALAWGAGPLVPVDIVVGPGNAYVTAAKYLVSRAVRIDMLAGPSELVVLAGSDANRSTVAADLLAQAEHDPAAVPIVVTTDRNLVAAVRRELIAQLDHLPTRDIAIEALAGGAAVVCTDVEDAIRTCNALAPEHLQLAGAEAESCAPLLRAYGSLFANAAAGEVLADYGIGPNHVLPTGGTARGGAGLSVMTFLRLQTWVRIHDPSGAAVMARDAAAFARLEGLEAHARAAERRLLSD